MENIGACVALFKFDWWMAGCPACPGNAPPQDAEAIVSVDVLGHGRTQLHSVGLAAVADWDAHSKVRRRCRLRANRAIERTGQQRRYACIGRPLIPNVMPSNFTNTGVA